MEISTCRVISALPAGPRTFLKSGKSAKKPLQRLSCKARGVMPSEKWERRNEPLRLDVQALCASKVELVVKVSVVFNKRIVLQLLLVVHWEKTVTTAPISGSCNVATCSLNCSGKSQTSFCKPWFLMPQQIKLRQHMLREGTRH